MTIWNGSGEAEALSDESSAEEWRSRWEPRYLNFLGGNKKNHGWFLVVLRVGVMVRCCSRQVGFFNGFYYFYYVFTMVHSKHMVFDNSTYYALLWFIIVYYYAYFFTMV